jgi:hypothetical protein
MASVESSSRARRRTKSLKMKTSSSSSSSTSLVNKASKILSSSKAIEVERIINRDGFGYFPMINE